MPFPVIYHFLYNMIKVKKKLIKTQVKLYLTILLGLRTDNLLSFILDTLLKDNDLWLFGKKIYFIMFEMREILIM